MNGIEAFIIGTVEHLEKGRWKIAGRACEDIRIGDTLRIISNNTKLEVLSISSYGREISVLYRMMTGHVVIGGKQDDYLENVRMLFI